VVSVIRGEPPDWAASGSMYGYGYGDGSASYWLRCIPFFASKWAQPRINRLAELERLGAKIAFWRSDERGCACQGGKNDPVKPGTIEKVKGPLKICSENALHGTLIPPRWPGVRLWVVALIGEIVGDEDKYGALEREIIAEVMNDEAP